MAVSLALFLPVLVPGSALAAAPTRIVTIDDADHDGRYTGADVQAAIERCKPGCILQALPQVYDDVAAWIGPGMPDGVVLQGAGIGKTVFRAPVPQQAPVVRVSEAPQNVVLSDFTVDGRKQEQTSAALAGEGSGISVSSPYRTVSPPGTIERVEAANFITVGIMVREGVGWEIYDSLIHDIGCNLDFPCPQLVQPKVDPFVKGRKTTGFGVSVIDANAPGTVVHNNTIWNVTKIGIEAFNSDPKQPPANFWFHDNQVSHAADSGITSNGGLNGRIESNVVQACGGTGIEGNLGAGITCESTVGTLSIRANTVSGNEGPGLRLDCQGQLTVADNLVRGDCWGGLGNFGEISAGNLLAPGNLVLTNDNALRGADGGGCAIGLFVSGWGSVTIDGGAYQGGSLAGVYLQRSQNVVIRNASIDGGRGVGVYIQPDVSGVSIDASVQISQPSGKLVVNTGAKNVTVTAASVPGTQNPPSAAQLTAPGAPALMAP
jgi:hypothetical protein